MNELLSPFISPKTYFVLPTGACFASGRFACSKEMFAWKLNHITKADDTLRKPLLPLGISAYYLKAGEFYAGRLRSGVIGLWSRSWYDHPLVTHRTIWPPAIDAWKAVSERYGNGYEVDPRQFAIAVMHVSQLHGISAPNGLCCMKTGFKSKDDDGADSDDA